MEIRKLIPEDAEKYYELRIEALMNNPEAFATTLEDAKKSSPEHFKERFLSDSTPTLGLFEQSRLVGNVTIRKETIPKMAHRASILAMYVTPEKRGNGAGRNLIEAACRVAEAMGVEQLYLAVVSTNEVAKKLYEQSGFQVFGTDKHAMKHNGHYVDEDLMVKFL